MPYVCQSAGRAAICTHSPVMKPLLALNSLRQDLIYAARSLRKSPGLATTVASLSALVLALRLRSSIFSTSLRTVSGRPITNRLQVANLSHKKSSQRSKRRMDIEQVRMPHAATIGVP
jgi:hypothetical protein